MGTFNPDYNRKNHNVLYVSITIIAIFLFAMSVSIFSESTLDHQTAVNDVYAQPLSRLEYSRSLAIRTLNIM
jgi:hypothetical protein